MLKLSGSATLAVSVGVLTYAGVACSKGSSRKVRLGVVGGNFGSQFFFHEHPNCEVTGVTDLRADRRGMLAQVYRCDTTYDSFEEMVEKARDIDAVAIFSEPANHVKHTVMALERGWHVLCACPACETVEEAHQLEDAVKKSGLAYMQAESSWYRTGVIFARNAFKEGALGEVFYTEAEYYHDRGSLEALNTNKQTRFWDPDGTPSWRRGYPPLGYPTHSTGCLVGVTGERITRVSALGWGQKHEFLADNRYDNRFWNECALMETDQGHMFRCNVFWLVPGHGERAQWYGDKAGMWMANHGEHGDFMRQRMGGGQKALKLPKYYNSDMIPEPMRHPSHHGDSAVFITAEFINAVVQQRTPEIDVYHSLAMVLPGIIGHQSALRGGEQLKVPVFSPS